MYLRVYAPAGTKEDMVALKEAPLRHEDEGLEYQQTRYRLAHVVLGAPRLGMLEFPLG